MYHQNPLIMTQIITIGRADDNIIVIPDSSASSHHAVISIESNGSMTITDQNSTNGTYVNGNRINKSKLSKTDVIKVGDNLIDWAKYIPLQNSNTREKTITIGRAKDNDVQIADQEISSHHAKLLITDDGKVFIEDLNSTNGTTVNGYKISRQQLNKGDQVLLAKKHPFNWEAHTKQPKATSISSAPFIQDKPKIQKRKTHTRLYVLGSAAVVLIFLTLIFFDSISKIIAPVDYTLKYKNTAVLVYHSYLLEAKVGDEVTLFTVGPNGFDYYDPSVNSPIAITGTGFFISDNGEIITNRHVALPWEYDAEKDRLVEAYKTLIRKNVTSTEGLQYALKTLNDIEVKGRTVYLGIALNESHVESTDDFIKCSFLKESGDKKIDVALLQTNSHTTPQKVTAYFDVNDAVIDEKEIKNGSEIFLIGYPAGLTLAETNKGIMANCQNGIVTRDPDGIDFGHNVPTIGGASGSPIFNNKGRLIGINYQGMTNTQGFNMAILAKYIKKITE